MLDSDGDGYPDRALRTCSTDDQQMYCSADTCPFAPNPDQADTSPCVGDETLGVHFNILFIVVSITLSHVADCPEETDEVWNIMWPFTPAGVPVTVSCGVDFIGTVNKTTV